MWLELSVVTYEGGHDQVDRKKQEVCVFCLCEVIIGDEITEIKCHHVFHSPCLDKWLELWGDTCPLCRVSFMDDNDGEEEDRGRRHRAGWEWE